MQKRSWIKKAIIKRHYKNIIKLWICGSKQAQKNLNEAFNHLVDFKDFGLPRYHLLHKETPQGLFFSKKLPFSDKEKKNLLYAPTRRKKDKNFYPLTENERRKIDKICEKKWMILYVNKHPYTPNKLFKNTYKNIIDISEQKKDIQEILRQIDILITDYSSIFVDFLLTKKPIIFFTPDLELYKNKNRELYYEHNEYMPNKRNAKNSKEYIKIIETLDKKKRENHAQNLTEIFHTHTDNKYIERLCNYLKI